MIPFSVIGVGPGGRDYLLPIALKTIERADLLMGSPRLLSGFKDLKKETFTYQSNLNEFLDFIEEFSESRRLAVLVSGDPGYHSLLGAVSRRFPEDSYEVIPGISSFQVAMARRKKPWQEDLVMSCHGKDFIEIGDFVFKALENSRRVILLTDNKRTPAAIAAELKNGRVAVKRIWLAENLTSPEESFLEKTVDELLETEEKEYRLCVMIIE